MRRRTAKIADSVSVQNKPHWSDQISEARELTEPQHFTSLKRWERDREPKKEFL